jgi:hypothetical protein
MTCVSGRPAVEWMCPAVTPGSPLVRFCPGKAVGAADRTKTESCGPERADLVSSPQQLFCSFDGTAFFDSRPRLAGANLRRSGLVSSYTFNFHPEAVGRKCPAAFSIGNRPPRDRFGRSFCLASARLSTCTTLSKWSWSHAHTWRRRRCIDQSPLDCMRDRASPRTNLSSLSHQVRANTRRVINMRLVKLRFA